MGNQIIAASLGVWAFSLILRRECNSDRLKLIYVLRQMRGIAIGV
ncbi:MAG: hypothetical protein AAGA60_00770 [Cyanobacteria bacterium P01_E01_bin.42]